MAIVLTADTENLHYLTNCQSYSRIIIGEIFMKNFQKVLGIIAFAALIVFSMTACNPDIGPGDGNGKDPGVGQLPDFPSGSSPALTKADANKILAELRQSGVLDSIHEEIWEVFYEQPETESYNYSFNDRSFPNGYVKVSASEAEIETFTGGFKTLEDRRMARREIWKIIEELYNNNPIDYAEISRLEEEIDRMYDEDENINFALNDSENFSFLYKDKGEVIKAKTENNVTIAQGSIFETQDSEDYNITVTTAGTYNTIRGNVTEKIKYHLIYAFTATCPAGSIKVIYNSICEEEYSTINERIGSGSGGTWTETEVFSGSLKVYGNKNTLLINHEITDIESYWIAHTMLEYDPYAFDPSGAIPLSSDVKVNGNITSGSPAWYSINVVNGTKYHLWWDDYDTTSTMLDVKVRGYNKDGDFLFDIDLDGDSTWSNYYSFTAASTGTVYIMVYPYTEEDSGAFSIAYNTNGTQPAMSVLDKGPSGASFLKQDSAAKPKKPLGFMRNNKRQQQ